MDVPDCIEALADDLARSGGVQAVVIGGSRATGRHRADSDWDVGVYYRGAIALDALATRGDVHPPGAWGRLMNGGSWLVLEGVRVDVLLRDLDAVEHWTNAAQRGDFEVDGLPGYVAGIPTYSLIAEADAAVAIRGALELETAFPAALRERAPTRWRFCRDFSLYHAAMHATRVNAVAAIGQTCRAVLEEAHARCCADGRWVMNEKHLIDAAELTDVNEMFNGRANDDAELARLVADVGVRLRTMP